jgi:hypothetical protein
MGVYDDHDFGWNNGNGRLPHKSEFKEMFLDAVGEPHDSPRRGATRGLWYKYTLNEGVDGGDIDVFLLDERYEREPLPCDTRRDYCEQVSVFTARDVMNKRRIYLHNSFAFLPINAAAADKLFCCWSIFVFTVL